MTRKIHILSFDGLSKVDMDYLKEKPNFKRLLDGSSYSFEVQSVYPSLTYPAHTSITTGNYPNRHGIVNNTLTQPFRKRPDWHWYAKDIKTKTFQQLATENGYTILSLLWPVTASAKIKYNMPEIFSNRPWSNQVMVSLRHGSRKYQIDMFLRHGEMLDGIKQPNLDNFTHLNYLYSLKKYKTNITMVHYIDLDSCRHENGFDSMEAKNALDRHDMRLGDILNLIEEQGEMEDTTIFVIGDHSSKDAKNVIFLNTIFKKHGYIQTNKKGQITDYQLIGKESGGSTYIYAKGEHSFEKIKEIILSELPKEAIHSIYTPEEAKELGADEECFMMLEANLDYLFEDEITPKPLMTTEELKGSNVSFHTNNHGYSPYLKDDYETLFIAKGKGIRKDYNIGKMKIVDEGPTFAALLGLELEDVDGRVLTEILTGE